MIAETPSEAKGKGVKAELPTLSTNCCQLSMKPGENMSCMLFELENFEDAKFFAQTLEVGKNDRNYDMMYGVYVDICECPASPWRETLLLRMGRRHLLFRVRSLEDI